MGLKVKLIRAIGYSAALLALLIVTFWLDQSSPSNRIKQLTHTSPIGSPLQLHSTPKVVPSVTFLDQNTNVTEIASFEGRMVLLKLWATWCAPCIKELPALDKLQQALNKNNFMVLVLSLDQGGLAEIVPFWSKLGLSNLDMYIDPSMNSGQILGARGLPTTILISKDGLEIARLEGPAEWDSEELIAHLSELAEAY